MPMRRRVYTVRRMRRGKSSEGMGKRLIDLRLREAPASMTMRARFPLEHRPRPSDPVDEA